MSFELWDVICARRFWRWFDRLADDNEALRFMIFFWVVVIPGCVIIPFVVYARYHFVSPGIEVGQLVGLGYMTILVLQKQLRRKG